MKIRKGFVSNSSSSSFIVVGVESKDLKDIPNDFDTFNNDNITGIMLDSFDEGSIGQLSIDEIVNASNDLKNVFGEDINIKLYSFTEYN